MNFPLLSTLIFLPLISSLFIFLSFTSLSAFSHQTFYVTNPNDNQGGSLRDALNMSSKSNHGSRIYISFKDDIKISKTLNYSGLYPVEIHGLALDLDLLKLFLQQRG